MNDKKITFNHSVKDDVKNRLKSRMKKLFVRKAKRFKGRSGTLVCSKHAKERAKERNINIGHLRDRIVVACVKFNNGRSSPCDSVTRIVCARPSATVIVFGGVDGKYLIVTMYSNAHKPE